MDAIGGLQDEAGLIADSTSPSPPTNRTAQSQDSLDSDNSYLHHILSETARYGEWASYVLKTYRVPREVRLLSHSFLNKIVLEMGGKYAFKA